MSESTIGIPVDEGRGCSEEWAVREILATCTENGPGALAGAGLATDPPELAKVKRQ